jgi:hypothetical protein
MGFWRGHDFQRQQIQKLCQRIGVLFTEDPDDIQEMWAEIGERLALEQPEFHRPQERGRPKKLESKEVLLAEKVEDEIRDGAKDITDAINRLLARRAISYISIETLKSQASRGAKQLEALRFHGAGDDVWSAFDCYRDDLRRNRVK